MFNFKKGNKKSELSRVESLALSTAQWYIYEMLPIEFKERRVFFTQVTITSVPVKEKTNKEFKVLKLKAHFTTLEKTLEFGREGMPPKRPTVEAEMQFVNEGSGCYVWNMYNFTISILNYPDIYQYATTSYFSYARRADSKETDWTRHLAHQKNWKEINERLDGFEERFEEFFKKISHNAPWGTAVLQDK